MSSFFNDLKSNNSSTKSSLMGPNYPYVKYINGTKRMGMGPQWSKIANNVSGLGAYVQILVEGGGRASRTGKPLGNKFFLKTAGKCKAVSVPCPGGKCKPSELTPVMEDSTNEKGETVKKQKLVNRYMFVNNIPDGNIPLVSSASGGTNFSTFKGLIPGMLSNLNVLNPGDLFKSFTMSTEPKCSKITMQTVDTNNNKRMETNYVPITEIKMINPCLFPDRKNKFRDPARGEDPKCNEAFVNMDEDSLLQSSEINSASLYEMVTSGDPIAKFYYVMIAFLATYIVHRLTRRR